MNSITRLIPLVAGLVLLMHVTPSWGQLVCASPGCNPTLSDLNHNTAGGTAALHSAFVGPLGVGAFANTAFGYDALFRNTIGIANTATGALGLFSNTGSFNTATGVEALFSNTDGGGNTASGSSALTSNTSGSNNTASGASALLANATGNFNTAAGVEALRSNIDGQKNREAGVGLSKMAQRSLSLSTEERRWGCSYCRARRP